MDTKELIASLTSEKNSISCVYCAKSLFNTTGIKRVLSGAGGGGKAANPAVLPGANVPAPVAIFPVACAPLLGPTPRT